MIFLYLLLFVLFFFLAYTNFRLAVGFFIILLPTYLIRFQIGPLPTTLLEIIFLALFLTWLIKYVKNDIKNIISFLIPHSSFLIPLIIFFLSSIIAIFISGDLISALGIWRAYFLEPILLFLILLGRRSQLSFDWLTQFLVFASVPISVYAVLQRIFNFGLDQNGRVLSFFSSPNAVALFLLPLVFLNIYLIWQNKKFFSVYTYSFILILNLVAIFLTNSQGAWIGLGAGMVVLLFLIGYKKASILLVSAGLLMAIFVPNIRLAVLFQDQASNHRLILWNQSWNYLKQSPYNFVFGSGLRQFYNKIQKPTHDWSVIYRQIYPHNIFLNFWTEIGLLGLLSFVVLYFYLLSTSFKIRKSNYIIGAVFISLLIAIFVHGLVDVPYFKNDLSFLWWIIIFLILDSYLYVNTAEQKTF